MCVSIFKAVLAILVCGWRASLKKTMKLPSIAETLAVFLPACLHYLKGDCIIQQKGATEFN
jgi:hypothetical protein